MRIIRRHRPKHVPAVEPHYKVNEEITAPEVLVIDEMGVSHGAIKLKAALDLARERGWDLVEVSPRANPPVCKLLEYGKFKYQIEKEARKQKAKQKEVELKGIRLTFRIGEHDIEMRKGQALEFLKRGDKVKVEMVLRGRERQHNNLASTIIHDFVKTIEAEKPIRVEQGLEKQAGRLTMIIAPK